MIGTYRVRARALDQLRGLEAVHARHLDVEQDDREVVAQERRERLVARVREHELVAERLEDRLERDEVLGPVVDEQDVRAPRLAHALSPGDADRAGRGRAGSGRCRRAAARRRRRVAASAAAGIVGTSASRRVLHDRRRRRGCLMPREPGRAVLVRAREDDPDQPLAVGVGGRLEEDVDRRPREVARARRSRARTSPARRAGGSRAGRRRRAPARSRSLSSASRTGYAECALQQRLEPARPRLGPAVLRDREARARAAPAGPSSSALTAPQAAPRRADHAELVRHLAHLPVEPLVGIELVVRVGVKREAGSSPCGRARARRTSTRLSWKSSCTWSCSGRSK